LGCVVADEIDLVALLIVGSLYHYFA
jgi:hypothetical protein